MERTLDFSAITVQSAPAAMDRQRPCMECMGRGNFGSTSVTKLPSGRSLRWVAARKQADRSNY